MPINYVQQSNTLDAKFFTIRQKNKCPLLCRWSVGRGSINAIAFSPDSVHIAISSQDGFLRIYDFHKQTIYGRMRSYFGGLLCVCWSPDGKYVVTGGEDDLVTVWSFENKKVVARGEGHRSYVSAVSFDPHMTILPSPEALKGADSAAGEGNLVRTQAEPTSVASGLETDSRSTLEAGSSFHLAEKVVAMGYTAYRLGSIGQDTLLCLWDLSGDTLKVRRLIARGRSRLSKQHRPVSTGDPSADMATSAAVSKVGGSQVTQGGKRQSDPSTSLVNNHYGSDPYLHTDDHSPIAISNQNPELSLPVDLSRMKESSPSVSVSSTSSVSSKKEKKRKKGKPKKKSSRSRSVKDPMRKVIKFVGGGFGSSGANSSHAGRPVETFESDDIAPKMHEVNIVEPLIAKKVSLERLTALVFREDCLLIACQEGFVSTWARPNFCMSEDEMQLRELSSPPCITDNTGVSA